jgi:predicted Zn-ribbon and HTH transcriptional regulator
MATRRQRIAELLEQGPMTVRGLAATLGVGINIVVDDLGHLARSLGKRLRVSAASCDACGFELARDKRFTAPSRCPRCKSESTSAPELSVTPEGSR